MTDVGAPPPAGPRITGAPRWAGAVGGLVAGLVAVSVGSLVARIFHRPTPVNAVGAVVIDHTPVSIREFAIRNFGRHDKLALQIGIVVILSVAAAEIGMASLRRAWVAAVGVGAFTLVGVACGVSRPGSSASASWAPVVGGLAALALLLVVVVQATARPAVERAGAPPPAGVRSMPTWSRASAGFERRRFLGGTAAALGVAFVAESLARNLERHATDAVERSAPAKLPAARSTDATVTDGTAQVDAATPYLTPVRDFYRIDTALDYPRVSADSWKLRIHGLVEQPLELTYADILARPQVKRAVTLTCVSNEVGGELIGNAEWQGVLLRDLLAQARPLPTAQQVATTSADGFTAGFPIAYGTDPHRDSMLAIGMNGRPLPLPHGFPARLVVPGLYGYVSATKWITDIELTTWDAFDGYWVGQGWSKRAPIKTQSRIDVPRGKVQAGRVAVAGVAWAQHTGIAKVEVRVDEGPWHVADLGNVESDDTWRQWVWAWEAEPGDHMLTVRATDKSGYTQTSEEAGPPPDGATGWHQREVIVE